MADKSISSNNKNGPIQVNSPQVDMHTIEGNFVSKVWNEVDSVMTMVETRVQGAILTAIENLVTPKVELAIKSANESSGQSVYGKIRGIFQGTLKAFKWLPRLE